MKETALKKLITILEKRKQAGSNPIDRAAIQRAINEVIKLLPTERQLIEDAYSEGYATAMYEAETIRRTTSTHYFTETYKTD